VIGSTEAEVEERIARIDARVRPFLGDAEADKFMAEYRDPNAAVGTPEQIVERLRTRAELGLGYAIHYFPEAAYDISGIELFEREVVPALG
jgi:alkanesulfonate monooxygenase SsuD/methylene tetrahydromethanopterin reductase-like flavin-dependent oxidoreductase (luciferase family)